MHPSFISVPPRANWAEGSRRCCSPGQLQACSAGQQDGWQETRLWYKGTAKNTLAEPDPLKRLAPAGNGIVFQRALSGIVRGKTVSLMLLSTGQMVSEPRSRAAFVRGARSGGREGSCFHVPVICCPWGHGAERRGQLAVPDTTLAGSPAPREQRVLNFHLVIALPGRQSSCAIVPLCNRGETCAGEMCHAHVCPAAEPRSLLPGDEWAMLTALPEPHPHQVNLGEPHQTHRQGMLALPGLKGARLWSPEEMGPGEGLPGSPASANRPQHPGGATAKLYHFPLQPRHLTRLL